MEGGSRPSLFLYDQRNKDKYGMVCPRVALDLVEETDASEEVTKMSS